MAKRLSERRMAENEVIFRSYNKRVQEGIDELNKIAVEHGQPPLRGTGSMLVYFYCECSDEKCQKRIKLSLHEYNKIHEEYNKFILLPGHEVPAFEDIIETKDGYCVVEKHIVPPMTAGRLNPTPIKNA